MGKSLKGGVFEREMCGILSLWWSNNRRDDLFWRTGGSGARARVRHQKGKRTHGQHSDMCATDPKGEPLIRALTIEMKRGYNKFTPFDVMDKPRKGVQQEFEKWVEQVHTAHLAAESVSWLIIHRRDKRQALVYFPPELYEFLEQCFEVDPVPRAEIFYRDAHGRNKMAICMRLTDFLERVTRSDIKALVE